LVYPPGGVRGEFTSSPPVKSLHGRHEADVPLLDEIL